MQVTKQTKVIIAVTQRQQNVVIPCVKHFAGGGFTRPVFGRVSNVNITILQLSK